MYISSEGEKKDAKSMNYEYLVNALAKSMREIFNSKNVEEYNKFISNVQVLYNEIYSRMDKFLAEKIDDESWVA